VISPTTDTRTQASKIADATPLGGIQFSFYFFPMSKTATPLVMPDIEQEEKSKSESEKDPGYLVICWNDPVNFMDYVTHVFQTVFGWQKQKAEFHMQQVHNQGKSVLIREALEKAEHYVHQLQKYSLHATMERDE
jgi:ATP-dependent Clp protease adaptor protein ClpS